jgi:SAM-dependent methyltransferase
MIFRREPLAEIIEYLRRASAWPVAIRVLDPDRGRGRYAGELVDDHVHRPFRTWVDLADRLDLRLRTPRAAEPPYVELVFEALDTSARWDREPEKYGAESAYQRITKLEDPCFVIDFLEALDRVALGDAPRVLDLGVNTGDELALIRTRYPGAAIVGIDRDASALAIARARYPGATFIEADIGQPSGAGTFDLVVSIGTLQSANLDDRDLLRRIVQDHLEPNGAVILGVPNCRYVDGEQRFGARMKNFSQPELGLLVKDVAFYRKYLQQHHRQVWVTGKSYILVTGGAHAS